MSFNEALHVLLALVGIYAGICVGYWLRERDELRARLPRLPPVQGGVDDQHTASLGKLYIRATRTAIPGLFVVDQVVPGNNVNLHETSQGDE